MKRNPKRATGPVVILLSALFASLSIFTLSCDDDPPFIVPIPLPSGLFIHSMDTVFIFSTDLMQTISIRVNPADLADNRVMRCFIEGEGIGSHFKLYDDGSNGVWKDSEGYADSISGDIAPDDGIFTRRIKSRFAVNTGNYRFSFALEGLPPPDTLYVNVTVRQNSPPEFVDIFIPAEIISGSQSDTFQTMMYDQDGWDDIVSVLMVLERQDFTFHDEIRFPLSRDNDSVWTWVVEPQIAVGLHTGEYPICFEAFDYKGSQGTIGVHSDTSYCLLENLPPIISEIEGPDTVWIPTHPDSINLFRFIINVTDDQTVLDLDSLYLDMYQVGDDNFHYQNSYYDNQDSVLSAEALDGIIVAGFHVDYTRNELTYHLHWQPQDKSGQLGETLIDTLVIWRRENSLLNLPEDFDGKYFEKSKNYTSPFK